MERMEPKMIIATKSPELASVDLAALGMNQVAYVKAVVVDGNAGYGIHAADGTPMAVVPDRAVAFAAIRQHDLEPVDAH